MDRHVDKEHASRRETGLSPTKAVLFLLNMSEMQEPFQELNAGIVAAGDAMADAITDDEFLQFRQKCERFHVLVMGSSAVGKTTLLERFAGDSIDKAQIKSPDGELVRIIAVFLMQLSSCFVPSEVPTIFGMKLRSPLDLASYSMTPRGSKLVRSRRGPLWGDSSRIYAIRPTLSNGFMPFGTFRRQ